MFWESRKGSGVESGLRGAPGDLRGKGVLVRGEGVPVRCAERAVRVQLRLQVRGLEPRSEVPAARNFLRHFSRAL